MDTLLGQCLVVGGGGFLGRALVGNLLSRGYPVRVLGRHTYPELMAKGAECIQGDIRNPQDVEAACRGCDTIFNTAAVCDIVRNHQIYREVNVDGCNNILRSCHQQGVKRFVFTSSPSVVMGSEDILNGNESLPYLTKYTAPYPATKAEAEKLVLANNTNDFRTCAIRPHLIWGAGDPHILPNILKLSVSNTLRQIGNGQNLVSITHVENAAYAHVLAAEELAQQGRCGGKPYFVNDEQPIVLWEWIAQVLTRLGVPGITGHIPYWFAYSAASLVELASKLFHFTPTLTRFVIRSLARSHTFSYAAAARDFGYTPLYSPQLGLEEMLTYFKSRLA